MSDWTAAGVLFCFLVWGWAMWESGADFGKKQGYATCVAEEDDDSVRVRRF